MLLTINVLKDICPEFNLEMCADAAVVLSSLDEFTREGTVFFSKAEKSVIVEERFSSLDNQLAALLWEVPYALIVGAGFPSDCVPDSAVQLLRYRIFADLCILPDMELVETEHAKVSEALRELYVERQAPLDDDLLTCIPPEKAAIGYVTVLKALLEELTLRHDDCL